MIARKPDEGNVILRDLGDGLILRKATQADAEELIAFNSFIHGNQEKGAPEYRHRGLVRAQFEIIHRWSAERSYKVLAITDNPYYYRLFGYELVVIYYEIMAGLSWAAVTPSIMRYLETAGVGIAPEWGEEPFGSFYFELGQEHPVYKVLLDRLPRIYKPYTWYLRLLDVPGFLRLIAPALEHRLAQSPMVRHSGDLKISFYREESHLTFEKGRLISVKAWTPVPEAHSGNAYFPGLTFLQLFFLATAAWKS